MSDAIQPQPTPTISSDEHPMDDIPVRPLEFDVEALTPEQIVWSRSSPEFSIYINAFGVHVPYFERYLIRSMSTAKKHITDERLRADMSAITGQEAHHAKNFLAFNKKLATRYPRVAQLDERARVFFTHRAKTDDLKRLVGFTSGYETFTFLAGMIILANYEKWLQDSDPTIKALWVWHQVEEVEHGAVAFEVYKALYGEQEWYRKYMILVALLHIVKELLAAYFHMCRVEGYFKSPGKAIKATWFVAATAGQMVWHCLPTFSRRYHPRRHPLATTKQNAIAIAWRRYIKKGGDVLKIDRDKMSRIISFS
ncbi:metal-dependent hydrolase [Pyruvatibacter sp.]|uniref:metal-dependent hydrolase n=1 Tax=Pyruvatibacter sp. TaxID=1981328 RepID=UPI0032EF4A99